MAAERELEGRIRRLRALVAETPESAGNWRRLAERLEAAGDAEGAITAWRRVLSLTPGAAEVCERLIALLVESGRAAQAIELARRGSQCAPEGGGAWKRLTRALAKIGDVGGEVEALEAMLGAQGEDDEVRRRLVKLLLQQGRKPEAARHLQALAMSSAAPELCNQLARLQAEVGDLGGEAATLERMLTLPGDAMAIRRRLVKSLVLQGRRPEAATHLAALAEAEPSEKDGWERLLGIQLEIGDEAGAAATLERILEIAHDPGVAERLVRLLIGLGRTGDAAVRLRAVAESAPLQPAIWARLVRLQADSGDVAGEIEALQRTAEIFGDDRPILSRLGRLLVAADRKADAIDCLRRLAEMDPSDRSGWERVARLQSDLGDASGEAATLTRLLTVAGEDLDVRGRLVKVLVGSGNPAAAAPHLWTLAEAGPTDMTRWKALARLLGDLGDAKGLREVLIRRIELGHDDPSLPGRLADLFLKDGLDRDAAGWARRAAAAAPREPQSWRRLARALDRAGQPAEAEAAWLELLALDRTDREANKRLADLRYRRGEAAGAAMHRDAARAQPAKQAKVFKHARDLPSGEAEEEIHQQLRRLAQDQRPIVAGPWQSEVGHELLYWIPFLRWVVQEFSIDPARMWVVSRGGAGGWYADIAAEGQYFDIFDCIEPEAFAELAEDRHRATGGRKAASLSPVDGEILRQLGIPADAHLLHPEMMFRLFRAFWKGAAPFGAYVGSTVIRPLPPPRHRILTELPDSYVAVKFYARPSFPMCEENLEFARRVVLELAERGPVVFMDTDVKADEHVDFVAPRHPNVMSIRPWLQANDNLLVQSAVASSATQMYGTYGGLAYLPLYYKTPVMSFFSEEGHFLRTHGQAAFHLADQMGTRLSVADSRPTAALMRRGQPPSGGSEPKASPELEPPVGDAPFAAPSRG